MSIIENRYPEKINTGDTIGIAAPAGSFNKEKFARGVEVLEQMGFSIYIPEQIMLEDSWFAGDDESRVSVLHDLFQNHDVKAILCARGGYGSMRILEQIDYDIIKKNPKLFAGFSDISALLSVINDRTGLVTYHAPVVTSLAESTEMTLSALSQMFMVKEDFILTAENGLAVTSGVGSGKIIGGNLTTLNHLVGTDYAPDFNDTILMLEDIAESPYKIDRMLTQMKLAGLFNSISGVALGTFENCGNYDEIMRIFEEIFFDDNIPVVGGFNFGHSKTNLPFPIGGRAILDAGSHSVVYTL